MEWIEVSIITKTEAVEAISGFLNEMGLGVSIEDPKDILNYKLRPDDWIVPDKNLIKGDINQAIVKVFLPEEANLAEKISLIETKLKNVSKYLDIGLGEVKVDKIDEQDWANAWKKYYKPVKIGERVVIKPMWEEYEASKNEVVVELDPGMAFGTGTHETTRMCVKLLEKLVSPESVVFDVGCGSGILGICASKLGASRVIGVDLDPVAVDATRKNAALNNLSNIDAREGNLLDVVDEKADIIVANIIADVIIYLTTVIKKYLKNNSVFVVSGIIRDRFDDVKNALEAGGFEIIQSQSEGEWVAAAAKIKK